MKNAHKISQLSFLQRTESTAVSVVLQQMWAKLQQPHQIHCKLQLVGKLCVEWNQIVIDVMVSATQAHYIHKIFSNFNSITYNKTPIRNPIRTHLQPVSHSCAVRVCVCLYFSDLIVELCTAYGVEGGSISLCAINLLDVI